MTQVENRPNPNDVVVEALALVKKAGEMRGAAITQLLAERERIERDLQSLGYDPADQAINNPTVSHANGFTRKPVPPRPNARRFRNLKLADVARILIKEHGPLHGKKLEESAKAGGFKGGTNNFQNYLPVALKRDGRFENMGGNVWRLKEVTGQTT